MSKSLFIISLLLLSGAALAQTSGRRLEGARIEGLDVWSIGSKTVDQDFSIIVNDGGVPTTALLVNGATGVVSFAVPLDAASIQAASVSNAGVVTTTAQSLAGAKTFTTGVVTPSLDVDGSAVAVRDVRVPLRDGSTGASGAILQVFNRFDTVGTGAQDLFTIVFNSAGQINIALCDNTTSGTNTGWRRITWSADGDTFASDNDAIVGTTTTMAFVGNTLQITPGSASDNEWCAYGFVMGRTLSDAAITWAL